MPAERRAIAVVFLLFGADTGTFASRLPWIAGRLHLSSGLLGVCVGLMMGIGATVTMPFAARVVHHYGPRASTRVMIAATGAALALPAFATDALVLSAVMLLTGAIYGTCDNAINAQGVEAEQRIGKSIMSGLHGMWSVGVLAGALLGSLAAREHVSPRVQFIVVGAVIVAGGVAATSFFAGSRPVAGDAPDIVVPKFAWPRGILLPIALVGFASIFVEVAGNDWSAVFMRWVMHASQAQAALATAVFAGSMAAGRLCGDAVIRRTGPALSMRYCGVASVAGCLLVALSPTAWAALFGFMLIGLGVSVVIPLVFAAAGHSGPSPALGVAGVATISYGAGLAAPSAMGGIADLASLRVAFAAAALLSSAVVFGSGLLGRTPISSARLQDPLQPVRRRSA